MITMISDLNTIINGLRVPAGNLAIPRSQMPQIDDQDSFKSVLSKNKIKWHEGTEEVSKLRLTQSEINKMKVLKMMRKIRSKGLKAFDPVIISKDNYVLDGSHRFVAKLNQSPKSRLGILRVDMDALELLDMLNKNRSEYGVRNRNYSNADISNPK